VPKGYLLLEGLSCNFWQGTPEVAQIFAYGKCLCIRICTMLLTWRVRSAPMSAQSASFRARICVRVVGRYIRTFKGSNPQNDILGPRMGLLSLKNVSKLILKLLKSHEWAFMGSSQTNTRWQTAAILNFVKMLIWRYLIKIWYKDVTRPCWDAHVTNKRIQN